LTADSDNTDRLVVLKDELKRMGIVLEPPDVNASVLPFTVAGPKRISYGLGALKGVGPSAVEAIVAERNAHGAYKSLVDLCRRVDLQKINRRVLEALVKSGGLDSLGANRATLMNGIPNALQAAERSMHAQAAGQTMLFGGDDERDDTLEHVLTPVREWSKRERLEGERESLGLYLTGHPFDDFAEHCKHFTNGAIAKVLQGLPSSALPYHVRKEAILAGVVVDVRRRGNRV
jgi:DNA polymerase-3 subunit alpha